MGSCFPCYSDDSFVVVRSCRGLCFVLLTLASLLCKTSTPAPTSQRLPLHTPCASCSQARHSPLLESLMIPSLPSFRCLLKCQRAISWLCYTTPHPNYSLSVGPALFFLWSVTINYRLSFVSSNRNVGVIKELCFLLNIQGLKQYIVGTQKTCITWMNKGMNEWCSTRNQEGSRIFQSKASGVTEGQRGVVLMRVRRKSLGCRASRQKSQETPPICTATFPTHPPHCTTLQAEEERAQFMGWNVGLSPRGLPVSRSPAKWAMRFWQLGWARRNSRSSTSRVSVKMQVALFPGNGRHVPSFHLCLLFVIWLLKIT